ncbi:MAG: hypothetical protein J5742_01050 [Alphaproteobacteria bacterium]|nr:hypothetical protein [Alphaproteobacteria bacterium]
MFKKLLLTSILTIAATTTFVMADGDKKVTSKNYVDTLVATKQDTIPATGNSTGGTGTSVVMYTGTAGTVGERGIYDGQTTYNSTNDANKLVTASALNNSVTNIPTIQTSKLTCQDSPDCTLWTVDDQTVYGQSN